MFASLTNSQIVAERVLAYDAPALSFLMEDTWSSGGLGQLRGVSRLLPAPVGADARFVHSPDGSGIWDHLIYAYMIENTRIYEIFGRVIWEYVHGERLGIPGRPQTFRWLRTTEELFYKDASPFQPYNLISRPRPDIAATRRNAYYRMFGMDLNHGRDGASSYPYFKPPVSNREFVSDMESFLRQAWVAISNRRNTAGPNSTDFAALADVATRLQNMLTGRRGGTASSPNLSREEFLAVSLMSWLAVTVSFNTPIVLDLVATGPSPEERLRQIGERVGIPVHGRSHSYFIIAPMVSALLRAIELGFFSTDVAAETIAFSPGIRRYVSRIIHHWSLISGRDLKAPGATLSPPTPSTTTPAIRAPEGSAVASGSGNGKVPVGSA